MKRLSFPLTCKIAALHQRCRSFALLLAVCSLLLGPELHAVEHTQTLNLSSGWNAVWLEVDPVDASGQAKAVEEVFADPAISYVATPRLPAGTAEFISQSSGGVFNQAAWRTWHRSNHQNLAPLQRRSNADSPRTHGRSPGSGLESGRETARLRRRGRTSPALGCQQSLRGGGSKVGAKLGLKGRPHRPATP